MILTQDNYKNLFDSIILSAIPQLSFDGKLKLIIENENIFYNKVYCEFITKLYNFRQIKTTMLNSKEFLNSPQNIYIEDQVL